MRGLQAACSGSFVHRTIVKGFRKGQDIKESKNNSKKSQITLAPDSWTGRMGMKSGMTQGDWHEAF